MLRELKRTNIELNKLEKSSIYRLEKNRMEYT